MPLTVTMSKPKHLDHELHCFVSFTNPQPSREGCDASYTNQSRIQIAEEVKPSVSKKDKYKSKYLKNVQSFTEECLYICFQSDSTL